MVMNVGEEEKLKVKFYKQFGVANALKENPPKKVVTVQINPVYSGDSMRPDSFEVTYQIGNKKEVTRTIRNQSGGLIGWKKR